MSDIFPVTFTVDGAPCSYKNSKVAIRLGKRSSIVPSKKSKAWMDSAIPQLEAQWVYTPIPKSVPLHVTVLCYMPTRLKTDLDNLLGGPGDALQRAGIIEDDSAIESWDGSRRLHDPERPRVEITINRFVEG